MKDLGNDKFSVSVAERIKIRTVVDKPPFSATFQDPPKGGAWQNIVSTNVDDEREFTAPASGTFSFDVEFDEAISTDDPDPVMRYTTTFVSLTNPDDPSSIKRTNVPKDGGAIPRSFNFRVV